MVSLSFFNAFALFLSIFVVFVNGWTDAPNSVFSVVTSKALSFKQAVILSAVFNFIGVFVFSLFEGKVTKNVLSLASFKNELFSSIACLSCFLTVILFGILAWFFGMPSSESHALVASLGGASLALGCFSSSIMLHFFKIIFFMALSCAISFTFTYAITLTLKAKRLPYGKLLAFSCGALSFMHGAQDGQKFIAIIMLLSNSEGDAPSLPLVLLVSSVMAISTLLGGKRIISSLSKSIEKCDTPLAFFSDLGSFFTLLLCSVLGMPISSGNVKSVSLAGGSQALKQGVNKKTITEILATSVITFPICFILGFILSKLLLFFT